MSFKKKLKKLKKDPIQFFIDSKLVKFFNINFLKNKQIQNKQILNKELIEPRLFGYIVGDWNNININFFNKKIIYSDLGFPTLFITNNFNKKLIHNNFIKILLNNSDFISFREKSLFFLRISSNFNNKKLSDNEIFKLINKYSILKENKLKFFRNLVVYNPKNIWPFILKKINFNIKLTVIVDNYESLNFIKEYIDEIDALIYSNNLNISFLNNIFRYEEFEDIILYKIKNLKWSKNINNKLTLKDYNFQFNYVNKTIEEKYEYIINLLKEILIDFSYKKERNLFLPVICNKDNFEKIDEYNDDLTIQGLIDFKNKSNNFNNKFEDIINNIEINQLFLRENVYCCYKTFILENKMNQKNLKKLLFKSLKDGVYYEKI